MNTETHRPNTIAGVSRAAMMVDLHISVYSGRKQDKATQGEVTAAKGSASKRAASVYKNLFAECKELDALTKFQARVRAEHYRLTLPWNDQGARLLPTAALLEYQQVMGRYRNEFDMLVDAFLDKYDTLVAAAAFQLGTLFDRKEYLSRVQVARRFRMESSFTPLPTSGDFRLDVESTVQRDLIEQYEARIEAKLAQANQDAWSRLHAALLRLSDRLVVEEDGTKRRFHDTMVTGALELCDLLRSLNVTNDPALTKASRQVEELLSGVTPKELRDEDSTRVQTKQQVDAILDAFDWGSDADAEVEDAGHGLAEA
ncbi:MAG: hypothetical protein ACKO0Z_01780 [Betaproteobacteria bacterium]